MRELAKSMMAASMGMGLLTAKTISRLASPKTTGDALEETEEFMNDLSRMTQNALGPELRKAFEYGDEMQRRMIDAGLGAMGINALNPNKIIKAGQESLDLATDVFSSTSKERES